MARIRIEDKTNSLCDTCKYATRVKNVGQNRVGIVCSQIRKFDEVSYVYPKDECGFWRDRNFVDLYDMKQVAWIVNTDKKNQIGFVSPKDLKDKDKSDHWRGGAKELDNLETMLPQKLKEL